jgi:hypothetical protein
MNISVSPGTSAPVNIGLHTHICIKIAIKGW